MAKHKRNHVPPGLSRHHREPESLGGKDTKENISYVPKCKHHAWTMLFDNYPASRVLILFREYLEVFYDLHPVLQSTMRSCMESVRTARILGGLVRVFNEEQLNEIKKTEREIRKQIEKLHAWIVLFGGMSFQQIVDEVNDVWLDYHYKLIITNLRNHEVVLRKIS